MEKVKISIVNIIGDVHVFEAEEGEKVFNIIVKVLNEGKGVVISFLNVEFITTAFLNTAIGQLYKSYSEEFIKEYIEVEDISNSGFIALKRVVQTAKLYYKDPDAIQRRIDAVNE